MHGEGASSKRTKIVKIAKETVKIKKLKIEVLIFKGDVLPKEDTRSVSYFCQSSEIYTRIRSGGTVVRAAPKTGVAQNGKLRSLGKPYSTNSPNVNPTWSGGGVPKTPPIRARQKRAHSR